MSLIECKVTWTLGVEFDSEQLGTDDPSEIAFLAASSATDLVQDTPAALSTFTVTLPDGSAYFVDVISNVVRPA